MIVKTSGKVTIGYNGWYNRFCIPAFLLPKNHKGTLIYLPPGKVVAATVTVSFVMPRLRKVKKST